MIILIFEGPPLKNILTETYAMTLPVRLPLRRPFPRPAPRTDTAPRRQSVGQRLLQVESKQIEGRGAHLELHETTLAFGGEMSKKRNMISAWAIGMFAMGCAGSVHRGVVAMKRSDTTAHVCIDEEEVNVGDQLALYRNECRRDVVNSKAKKTTCIKKKLGVGTVTGILNEHFSVVEVHPGVRFREGDVVEREHN